MKKVKAVYFNRQSETALLSFADQQQNFSEWVKAHIREALVESIVAQKLAEKERLKV